MARTGRPKRDEEACETFASNLDKIMTQTPLPEQRPRSCFRRATRHSQQMAKREALPKRTIVNRNGKRIENNGGNSNELTPQPKVARIEKQRQTIQTFRQGSRKPLPCPVSWIRLH